MKPTAFIIGCILLSINIAGFFIPLKNPAIYTEQKTGFINDTTLSYKETLLQLNSLHKENQKDYVAAVNNIFNQSILHITGRMKASKNIV